MSAALRDLLESLLPFLSESDSVLRDLFLNIFKRERDLFLFVSLYGTHVCRYPQRTEDALDPSELKLEL